MPKLLSITALSAALVLVTAPTRADDPKGAAKLEGGYTIVSGEEDGKATPAAKIRGATVRFTADTITGTSPDKKEFFAAKYTLDTGKTPWVIKMTSTTPKVAESVGLIKKEGDTITLVYSLPGVPAPTEFKTRQGQHLFVLRNIKAGTSKP